MPKIIDRRQPDLIKPVIDLLEGGPFRYRRSSIHPKDSVYIVKCGWLSDKVICGVCYRGNDISFIVEDNKYIDYIVEFATKVETALNKKCEVYIRD